MTLSTHVLDVEAGRPVAGLAVAAELRDEDGGWRSVGAAATDADGRVAELVAAEHWAPGRWRVVFATADHHGPDAFYPSVTVEISVPPTAAHLHVPLLLSRHGYTTYRGS